MSNATLNKAPIAETTAELEARYREQFNPPAGYKLSMTDWDIRELHLVPEYSGEWTGPELHGKNWRITSHWTNQGGVKLWVDHTKDGKEDHEPFTLAEALEMSVALATLAQQVTV